MEQYIRIIAQKGTVLERAQLLRSTSGIPTTIDNNWILSHNLLPDYKHPHRINIKYALYVLYKTLFDQFCRMNGLGFVVFETRPRAVKLETDTDWISIIIHCIPLHHGG